MYCNRSWLRVYFAFKIYVVISRSGFLYAKEIGTMNTFMDALTKNEKSYTAMMVLYIVRVVVN